LIHRSGAAFHDKHGLRAAQLAAQLFLHSFHNRRGLTYSCASI
jgi:hypothetical protein